jgi:hypothetical protein
MSIRPLASVMPSVRASVALAVFAVLVPAAAPSAGAQWSPPQTLSREHFSVWPGPAIGFTANGTAVASWGWQDGMGNDAVVGFSLATRAASDPDFGPERELSAGDLVAGPAPYGSNRAIVARLRDRDLGRDRLRVQFGDVGGRFGRPRVVARRTGIRNVRLAVNARGQAALAWFEDRGTHGDRVYVSLRRAGGSFGRPRRLVRERIRNVSVAVGPAGDVLVAWDARGTIRTRFKGRSRRGFRRADTLRSEDTFFAAIQTAVAASGRAWVAWTAQLLTEGGGPGDAFVQAAVRPPARRRFRPALLLAHGSGFVRAMPVSLVLDAEGAATLAWTVWQDETTTVQAARVSRSGTPVVADVTRFPSIEPLDTASAAAGADGTAVVAWSQAAAFNTSRVYASLQPPGGAWGAPELVSDGLQANAPIAAYPPPRRGPPVVAFANHPTAQLMGSVAQVATRRG